MLKEKPLRTGLFIPVEFSFFHDERVSALAKERSQRLGFFPKEAGR